MGRGGGELLISEITASVLDYRVLGGGGGGGRKKKKRRKKEEKKEEKCHAHSFKCHGIYYPKTDSNQITSQEFIGHMAQHFMTTIPVTRASNGIHEFVKCCIQRWVTSPFDTALFGGLQPMGAFPSLLPL